MIRRVLISALVVILVQTSLPVSASAEQPAPAKGEQTNGATSAQPCVYADLPQVMRTLDLPGSAYGRLKGSLPRRSTHVARALTLSFATKRARLDCGIVNSMWI